MSDTNDTGVEKVAIVGMAARLPGARSLSEFWNNLASGVGSVSHFRSDELEYSLASKNPEKAASCVAARSILPDADLFDAAFFNIYPKQAELMDPQHRVFLECAWEALESAGYDPERFPGLIGLYAGLSLNTYLLHNISSKPGFAPAFAASYPGGSYDTLFGNDKDFMTTRVAHKLNLRGPCVTVQTACSTSLVAVMHAYYSLLTYQCDMALAGGVSITFPQRRDYLYEPDGMVSRDGTCRTFDSEASGTVFGSGAGVVVLKRLSDALAAGDTIHAVILGGAMNNDGSARAGYAAPGVDGQAEVVALAHAASGVSPDSISYIEAHGTGTPLGDPIEIAALTQAFRRGTSRRGFCAVGSAKTNIGHLDMAAGVTGLIKTVLQLENERIAPLLHFAKPNPRIDFENSPFYPAARLQEWKRGQEPRRAGVSAFGVGGTNAHLILEEAPLSPEREPHVREHLLPISARTETALARMASNLADHLSAHSDINIEDVAFTLQQGRREFPHRLSVVAATPEEAAAALRERSAKPAPPATPQRRVAFLFPGQGSQYAGMGAGLYRTEPVYRAEVDRCARILQEPLGRDIRTVIQPDEAGRSEAERAINETWITQPSIFVIEYALARLLMAWGIRPDVVLGHSIGEYVAAVLAETLTLEDALGLLARRAKLMQALPAGSMLAVRRGADEIAGLLPQGASIAAFNSANLVTVSGPTGTIAAFQRDLEQRKIASRLLATSHAFHSSMMDPMLEEFTAIARATPRQAPHLRWVSTCTGTWMTEADAADPGYWGRQLRQAVRFAPALDTIAAESDLVLLEVGPGNTLTQLGRQHPILQKSVAAIPVLPGGVEVGDRKSVLDAVGRLWAAGFTPDWKAFDPAEGARRIPLPTYPFERKRHWVEPARTEVPQTAVVTAPPQAESANATIPFQTEAMPSMTDSSPSPARRSALADQIRALIKDLSGVEVSSDTTSLMELGFDSLFLTQASQALQSKFGVKVTFRQMLGDLCSVAALAAHLDQELPADQAPAVPPAAAPAATATVATPALPGGGSLLEQLLAQQLQTMQLLVGQQRAASQPAPTPAPPSGPPPVTWPGPKAPGAGTVETGKEFKRFGPYKPIEKGEKGGLTARQQQGLDKLIAEYVARTSASKRYTAEHRAHFADPRAVSGFKLNWKEMIYPIVSARSKGSRIWDLDGNEYVDITMGFGTYFFGHSPDWLAPILEEQLRTGIEIGPQSPVAGEVARLVCEFTGMERATFCNTGSEAVMAAMRLARTVTGRSRIVYFTGDYHGMFEEVLVRGAWVDGKYRSQPIAPGIPSNLVENILVLEYGAPESLEIIRGHSKEIAAVMVEPVQSRNPSLRPAQFLHDLRDITARAGIALVFDEVVTGFRCHPGGAQAYFGIRADMATYGKVVGGGMPIGVLAGSRTYLDALDGGSWNYGDESFPEVGVTFFAGTFVRHPLAMAAAHAVLKRLKEAGPVLQMGLTERVSRLSRTLNSHFERIQVPLRFPTFSAVGMIEHAHDLKHASLLWYYLRKHGIHVWEGRPCIFTLAHTNEDFDRIVDAFKRSVAEMQEAGFLPESPLDVTGAASDGAPAYPREDTSPLTPAQHEIFYSVQMGDEANCAYNESSMLRFRGSLDSPAMESALLHLVERHPALRSTFTADGTLQVYQAAPARLDLPLVDYSQLPAPEATEALRKLGHAEQGTPFNLTNGPLLRCQLVKLPGDDHVLLLTAHHLVCDGWSFGMLVAELATAYNARRAGRIILLPPPMPFGDYAREQAGRRDDPAIRAAEEYWVSQFADGAPVLELPTDRPRPALKSFAGAMETRTITGETFAQLKRATSQIGGTLFTTLLGAFATLLHRLTGQQDIVVGIPAAGQTMVGSNELIGHCLNFLPVRLRPAADATFAGFSKVVKSAVLDAYEHQDFTYGTLVQKLKLPRDTSRLPLVSVMFNIDKTGVDLVRFDGLELSVATNPKRFVNFEIFFNLVQSETSLDVECEYNTDLFDRATILSWLAAFEALVGGIIASSQSRLDALPLLDSAGRRLLVEEFNRTEHEYPRDQTVHGLFQEQASRVPRATAVRFGDEAITYRDLDAASTTLAARLRELGCGPGRLVGICVERSIPMVTAVLGILKSGAAYVPMDPSFPAERLGMMIEDAAMQVVVTSRKSSGSLPSHNARTVLIDEPIAGSNGNLTPQGKAEDLAYVIFTSGSTGRPKGVQVPHRAVVNFLNSMRREPGLSPNDVLLSVTTLSFDIAGLELFLPLTTGATVIVASRETAADGNLLARDIDRHGVTVMQATPTTWRLLLEAGWKGSSGLKVLIGGESVPRDLVNRLVPLVGSVWNVYGPTETTIWSTTGRLATGDGPVSIGRPIDNTQIYIVSPSMQLQPVGVPGELLIAGDGVALGYHNRPELTAERFAADPFAERPGNRLYRTGDLARWRADGTLECLGRLDQQVKVRGFRIELGEVEAALDQHPLVKQSVVDAREDVPGQKRLVGYVTLRDPASDNASLVSALRAHLASCLPDYMVPSAFVVLPALPTTPNGKVNRRALPAPAAPAASASSPSAAPRNRNDEILAEIWRTVLRVDRVGIHDDVFELGGDSILVFQISARANKAGLALTPADVFRHRTIARLSDRLEAGATASAPRPITAVNREAHRRRAPVTTQP